MCACWSAPARSASVADDGALPVPRSVTALYVVLTAEPLARGDAPAPPLPPAGLLLARGSRPEEVERFASRSQPSAVVLESALDEAWAGEARARAAARDLAQRHDGVVVDSAVPRLLDLRAEVRDHVCATDWFVFEHRDTEIRTHGISRFGLPELRCGDVPTARLAMYDAVLVGVAQRVIEEWPANDPGGPATITMRDIARGYGDLSAGGDDPTLLRSLAATLTYARADQALEVRLHDDPATALFAPDPPART